MQRVSPPPPPPNPQHQRQVIWQIWLPLIFFILVFLGLGALAILLTSRSNPVAGQWAALSVIWIIIPTCFSGLFTLAFLGVGIFLSGKAYQGLPGITYKIQHFFKQITAIIGYYADRIAEPVIGIGSRWAGVRSVFKSKKSSTNH